MRSILIQAHFDDTLLFGASLGRALNDFLDLSKIFSPHPSPRKSRRKYRLLPKQRKLVCITKGYEVHGIEKIPEGPGLIVYYHGATSVDYHFFVCNLYIQTGRVSYSVVDRFLRIVPGLQLYLKLLTAVYGGREQCVEILKKGNLLGVAPGGARESFFSDENYGILWGNRKGFAQVAIDAKVPIIPLFTQNIREVCRTFGTTWFIRWLNERFQLPFAPEYGWFPVKLCTYIGDPIPYDPNITATELVEKTKIAIEALRDRHQKLPGNISRALLERFDKHQKDD
ncbi:transmembrane protein 68-like isoform X2 [Mauremys reevesii]|uniref:transmembrane protein 68-like isoform X2 n=1 Tax=Mauremys reevesii TaxID=260615 RepID=UPI00193FEA56|nr:transmembrane protein 68-like isoform X2 [Mauremys reevesii]